MSKKPAAADQFAALGLDQSVWTEPMRIAVAQKWSGLPVDTKVGDLRDQLAAPYELVVPTVDELIEAAAAAGGGDTADDDALGVRAAAEHARLTRNAKVNAWRARTKLQAALDARELRFAALRAAKAAPAAGVVVPESAVA